jgi:hypothetical protein
MPATVIYREIPYEAPSASAEGENLWLSLEDLRASTGWELKPQGLCRGERCVPIPSGRETEFLDDKERFNLAAFAHYLGQPIVHDGRHQVWMFGDAATSRQEALLSLDAPDFSLPDLDGKMHSLSQYRGRKVLLLSWASW